MGPDYRRRTPQFSTMKGKDVNRRLRRNLVSESRRGADELMNLAEHVLRNRPFQLRLAREIYVQCCSDLILALEVTSR